MKKALYGSTALVAAGVLGAASAAAEEGISAGVSGYYQSYFAVGNTDVNDGTNVDYGSTNIFRDGEVHVKGSTTLDNGISFGVQVELEAFQSGHQIGRAHV